MSEKRFIMSKNVAERDQTGIIDVEKQSLLWVIEVVDKLNEQQATIQSLKGDKAIAEDYANIFEKENVKLRKQIGEQQSTITRLEEENEQLRKQVAECKMILRQHEFAEKEGFQ